MSRRSSQVYGWYWRTVIRPAVLERDGYICQVRGPRCLVKATQADHIVAVEHGGAWYDFDNLRAACRPCNAGRMMREAARGGMAVPVVRPSREW